jgi:hypothetical protein
MITKLFHHFEIKKTNSMLNTMLVNLPFEPLFTSIQKFIFILNINIMLFLKIFNISVIKMIEIFM